MLESMRNQAQSWIAKLILGGIALSFVLWGIGDYFMGSRVEPVAEVDGNPISAAEFAQAYERQLNAYRSMLGKNFSKSLVESLGIKENTLQTLINRRLMLDEAKSLGLAAPEATLVAAVQENPAFLSNGRFDPQRYRILTRNMGFASPQDYENELRLDLMVDALQKAITGSANVSEQEIRDRFNHDYQQRVLAAIIVDPSTLLDKVEVSEKQAKQWYEAHPELYKSPLRVKLNLVDIDPNAIAADITVDEKDIQEAYDKRKSEFMLPEQRKARHILIKMPASAPEVAKEDMRKKAEAALARIKAGEDFAKVAKEVSEDSTAAKGGELGWFTKGTMVPAFDAAVFGMKKGEVSGIVETRFGYHIIQLEDIRPAHQQTLAEVHDQLQQQIRKARAADEAYKLSQDLDDELGQEGSLQKAAENLNLKVHAIGPVSQSEAVAEPELADAKLRSKVFATMPGQAVDIEETADGHFIAFEVTERKDPEVLPYAEVTAKAMRDARSSEADKEARKLADKILAASADKSIDQLAQQFAQPKYISKPVRANGAGDMASWLTGEVVDSGFRTAKGQWLGKVMNVPQGLAIVQVEEVIPAPEKQFAAEKGAIEAEVEKSKGAVRFARWMATVRDQHKIEMTPGALAHF